MNNEVIAILIAGIITLIIKGFFIEVLSQKKLPPVVLLALNHVPTAVLAALAFPMFFNNNFAISHNVGALLIAFMVIVLAWRFKNLLISVGIPFSVLLIFLFY